MTEIWGEKTAQLGRSVFPSALRRINARRLAVKTQITVVKTKKTVKFTIDGTDLTVSHKKYRIRKKLARIALKEAREIQTRMLEVIKERGGDVSCS